MSIQPSECPYLSICPEGSSAATAVGDGFAVVGILLFIIAIIYFILNFIQRKTTFTQSENLEKRLQEFNVVNALLRTILGTNNENLSLKGFVPKRNRVSISFDRLGLVLPNGKQVLNGVTGTFRHSTLVSLIPNAFMI
jgi:hypothetical protein